MRIGFIGAGRMGFTLGRHFAGSNMLETVGYYSKNPDSARSAAKFTDTLYYNDIRSLVEQSEAVFLTVPDGALASVISELDGFGEGISGKIICHTSGAVGSDIFSGMKSQVYGYSIHPIYAVSSKTESYKNFSECFITIEGCDRYLEWFREAFLDMGHRVRIINASDKPKYHAAAVFSSNLVIGLYSMAVSLLKDCGFDGDEACLALKPLFMNNASSMFEYGLKKALTGPVSRGDYETVEKHLEVLDGDTKSVYECLSRKLIDIAGLDDGERKNKLMEILQV